MTDVCISRSRMKEVELSKFYFHFQVYALRFLGIEVLIGSESFTYRIYSFIILTFTATYVFVECIEVFFHSDFYTIVVCCNYAISHFLGMIKVGVLYSNRKQIGKLLVSLHEGVYKPDENRCGIFERQCIKNTMKREGIQTFSYGMSIVIVVGLGLIIGLKSWFTQPPELWKPSFAPISIVNTTYSPRFEIAYVYQGLGVFMISMCVFTTDVTVIGIISHMVAQLKILEKTLRTYESRALKRYNSRMHKSMEESMSKTLQECVDHHLHILETVNTVEQLCRYLALCVFISNLILLCLLMYYTSLMPLKSLGFLQYLVYCFLIATQVFLYCWWGNEMTLANEAIAVAAFQTYNPSRHVSHAKMLQLIMIRAQRPLILTAGKFVPLSVETYKAIIKGSFSYFMVLRRINST